MKGSLGVVEVTLGGPWDHWAVHLAQLWGTRKLPWGLVGSIDGHQGWLFVGARPFMILGAVQTGNLSSKMFKLSQEFRWLRDCRGSLGVQWEG